MKPYKVLRVNEVVQITGISPSTISRLEKANRFPKRKQIGVRAVGWLESDILQWLNSRPEQNKEARNES